MRIRLALLAPLACSLAAHAAFLGGLAAAGRAGRNVGSRENIVPVTRAVDPPADPRTRGEPREIDLPGSEGGALLCGEDVISIDTEDPRYHDYLLGVRKRIWECWGAPRMAAGEVSRGSLIVEFSLARSGKLAGVDVRKPSGRPALDRAALDAVRRAHPFAAFPASIDREALRIRTRFVYE